LQEIWHVQFLNAALGEQLWRIPLENTKNGERVDDVNEIPEGSAKGLPCKVQVPFSHKIDSLILNFRKARWIMDEVREVRF